jgi:AmmeMemoRadiSam system protein A
MLNQSDKRLLLSTAHKAIESAVFHHPNLEMSETPVALSAPCGAFVTIYIKGKLRGCIGYLTGVLPLIETVRDVAVKAATCDPRFLPLTQDEYPEISIEISVLSPLKLVRNVEEIHVGTHGILIEGAWARGVLLPQVAVEYGWNREQFLRETSRKAGGPHDLWKQPDVKIYTFTAEVVSEKEQ